MCDYVGCNKPAVLELRQKVGKKQVTKCCKEHAPSWALKDELTPLQKRWKKKFGQDVPCAFKVVKL